MSENEQKGTQNLNQLKARLGLRAGEQAAAPGRDVGTGATPGDALVDPFATPLPVATGPAEIALLGGGIAGEVSKKRGSSVVIAVVLTVVGLIVGAALEVSWDSHNRGKEATAQANDAIKQIRKQWNDKVLPVQEILQKSSGNILKNAAIDWDAIAKLKDMKFEDADETRNRIFKSLVAGDMPNEIIYALYNYFYYLDQLQRQANEHADAMLGDREVFEKNLKTALEKKSILESGGLYLVLQNGQGGEHSAVLAEATGAPECQKQPCAPGERKVPIRFTYGMGKSEPRSIDLRVGAVVRLAPSEFSRTALLGQPIERDLAEYVRRSRDIAGTLERLAASQKQVLDLLAKRAEHGK